ncbi:MAG: IS200/IS605 family transposase [Cyclobacteriaceae bacterium]|nr:IS200/IS605 family transposase [Cyclobacteriaceae bacterium]
MANTYTELTVQAIFAVKNRKNVITGVWRDELHRYISGILTKDGMKSLAVGGWSDHVHILFGIPPTRNLSDVIRVVKTNSSKWISERGFVDGVFQWQEGYGGFSYSVSQRDAVIKYIMNQEQHHGSLSFRDEYMGLLKDFEVEADSRYLFDFFL